MEAESPKGVLLTYLDEDRLIEKTPEGEVARFKHEELDDRDPKGPLDFTLQVMADFASEEGYGGKILWNCQVINLTSNT